MKRLILCVILACMCPMVFGQEADPRIPVAGLCKQDPQSLQEVRFCKVFTKSMGKYEHYREAIPPEPAMVFTVIAVDDPESDKMAYSLVVVLYSDQLAGFQPIVWQRAGLVAYCDFKTEIEDILELSFRVIVKWLPGAVEASRNLCPDNTGQYKSVGLCYEHEVDGTVSEGIDTWDFEVQ
jgi:hypothetical protein